MARAKCPKCGAVVDIPAGVVRAACKACGAVLKVSGVKTRNEKGLRVASGQTLEVQAAERASVRHLAGTSATGTGPLHREPGLLAAKALRVCALIALLGGIVGGIVFLAAMEQRSGASRSEGIPPIAFVIGLPLQGIFACALFSVIASMAENLIFDPPTPHASA